MNSLTVKFLLYFILTNSLLAHRNFWDIKGTVLPAPESITFDLFFSFDQLKEYFKDQLKFENYSSSNKAEFTEKLVELSPQLLSVTSGGKTLRPFVKSVNISTGNPGENQAEEFSLAQVDIDIELIYTFPSDATQLEFKWYVFADDLIKSKTNDISKIPKGALDVPVYFFDANLSKYIINSSNNEFTWKTDSTEKKIEIPVIKNKKTARVTSVKMLGLSAFIFITGFAIWIMTVRKPFGILAFAVCSLALLLIPFSKYETSYSEKTFKNSKELSEFMSYALKRIYISAGSVEPETKWQMLNGIGSNRFKEKLLIDNFHNKESSIGSFVEDIKIDSLHISDSNTIECTWTVNALFQHLSHMHSKSFTFKGDFNFEEVDNKWLIDHVQIRRVL